MYEFPFYITEPVSNNAFSFSQRLSLKGESRLYVPQCRTGKLSDAASGTEIVFEDFDDGRLRSCTGLSSFIKAESPFNSAPVYLFDNHNHAFAFIAAEKKRGSITGSEVIVHVDQHRDTRMPDSFLKKDYLLSDKAVFEYTNTVLNVGNFIPAVLHSGLAAEMVFIGSEETIDCFDFEAAERKGIILDIDLDFFAPELDYIPAEKKISFIRKLLEKAALTTVATSPFFIETDLALNYLRRIFNS